MFLFVYNSNQYKHTRNMLDQLNLSPQIILQLLIDLENTITYSRINTLHNTIVKKMKWIGDIMHITKSFFSNSVIIFVLHFPIVHPENVILYHLYLVPTINQTTIIPRSPFSQDCINIQISRRKLGNKYLY